MQYTSVLDFVRVRARVRLIFAAASIASLVACSHAAGLAPAIRTQSSAHDVGQIKPGSSGQTHVLTFDYLAEFAPRLPLLKIVPWTSWAVASAAQSLVLHPLGVHTLIYTDPNITGPGDRLYSNDESTFAHACGGARIGYKKKPGKFMMDPHSGNLALMWKNLIGEIGNLGLFDGAFEDSGFTAYAARKLPCNFNTPEWVEASTDAIQFSQSSIVYNGLGAFLFSNGQWSMSPAINFNPAAIGGTMEGCYSGNDDPPKPGDQVWVVMQNTELRMVRENKLFFCRGLSMTDASSAIDQRVYMYASFLLTYDPSTSVISQKFSTPSGFLVDPEVSFVPTAPLQPEPATVDSLMLSGGSYGREYQQCYLRGTSVGSCAVVVNSSRFSNTTFPWPSKYHHTLVLRGSGVLDGGAVASNGPAPQNSIAPTTGVIAIQ